MTRFPTGEPLEELITVEDCKIEVRLGRKDMLYCIPPERHDSLLEPYNTGFNYCRKMMIKNLKEKGIEHE